MVQLAVASTAVMAQPGPSHATGSAATPKASGSPQGELPEQTLHGNAATTNCGVNVPSDSVSTAPNLSVEASQSQAGTSGSNSILKAQLSAPRQCAQPISAQSAKKIHEDENLIVGGNVPTVSTLAPTSAQGNSTLIKSLLASKVRRMEMGVHIEVWRRTEATFITARKYSLEHYGGFCLLRGRSHNLTTVFTRIQSRYMGMQSS